MFNYTKEVALNMKKELHNLMNFAKSLMITNQIRNEELYDLLTIE